MNLIVYYGKDKSILNIVSKYKKIYKASSFEIKTINKINYIDKIKSSFFNDKLNIKKSNINLNQYENIILISSLWFNKIPSPVIRFLEINTGNINNIIYVLFNNNKKDFPKEFDKMDKILNLRRDKSYYVSLDKKEMHIRVYQ